MKLSSYYCGLANVICGYLVGGETVKPITQTLEI